MNGKRQKIQPGLALQPRDWGEPSVGGSQGVEPSMAKSTLESPAPTDRMSPSTLNPVEPPWYGPVCPVVWEGRHREVPPYPDYSSCVNVALGFDAGILPEGSHAVAFPRDAGSILTILTNSSLMASRVAPEGKALVHAMVIDKDAEALFPLSDAEIGTRIVEEIRRFLPAMPEPLFTRAYHWPEALCICPGGVLREIHAMRMEGPQGLDGLFLAGDYMRMPLCNGAMASGVDAAERSAAHVSGLQANRPGSVGLGVNEQTEALGDPPGSICS